MPYAVFWDSRDTTKEALNKEILMQLLKKGGFEWSEEANRVFKEFKLAMVSTPVLALPNFDKKFTIETDASGGGIGAVLSQNGRPLAIISKGLKLAMVSTPGPCTRKRCSLY